MVVIIDDREDVWNFAPNLIHVRPYHFFQHTGDINAPPGLAKREKDEKEGFDFATMKNKEPDSKDDAPSDSQVPEASESTEGGAEKESPSETQNDVVNDVPSEENTRNESTPNDQIDEKSDVSKSESNETEVKAASEGTSDLTEEAKAGEKNDDSTDDGSLEKPKIHLNDTDDYLLYLQEILKTVHHAYYEMYDNNKRSGKDNPIPDMKKVLPYVRRKVLENVRAVFSGLIPVKAKLENTRPFLVAKSLGAVVEDKVTAKTTHLVAAKPGTSKVRVLIFY